MKTIYLSLGSNLGDREAHLRAAIAVSERASLRKPDLFNLGIAFGYSFE